MASRGEAARALGASTPRILAHHIAPNLVAPLLVQMSLSFGNVIAAEASIFIQVALGVANLAGNRAPGDDFHIFYGFVALVTVGILYGYRNQVRAWAYLLYGLGGLFLMGLCIRALLLA